MSKNKYIIVAVFLNFNAFGGYEEALEFQQAWQEDVITWEQVKKRAVAEGEVNWYYPTDGQYKQLDPWVEKVVKPAMAQKGIKLNNFQFRNIQDIIDIIDSDNQKKVRIGEGQVDVFWSGNNYFLEIHNKNLLFGSFANRLPNSINFEFNGLDPRSVSNIKSFGVDTDYKEMPWGMEQHVCYVDRKRVIKKETPHSYEELASWLKNNMGRFTYIQPSHAVGGLFVRSVLYGLSKESVSVWQKDIKNLTIEELKALLIPGFQYLRDIKPYLLKEEGQIRYAKSPEDLHELYRKNKVDIVCDRGIFLVSNLREEGKFSETTEMIILPISGQIRNKNYLTITKHASHPAAALVLINFLSSVEMQASKMQFAKLPSGVDNWKLRIEDQAILNDAIPELYGITFDVLNNVAVPDIHASLIPIITKVWEEYIAQDSDLALEDIVRVIYR